MKCVFALNIFFSQRYVSGYNTKGFWLILWSCNNNYKIGKTALHVYITNINNSYNRQLRKYKLKKYSEKYNFIFSPSLNATTEKKKRKMPAYGRH